MTWHQWLSVFILLVAPIKTPCRASLAVVLRGSAASMLFIIVGCRNLPVLAQPTDAGRSPCMFLPYHLYTFFHTSGCRHYTCSISEIRDHRQENKR